MPIYLIQLATGYKSFIANPILGSKTLNRWGLHTKRVEIAMKMADWRREKLAKNIAKEYQTQYQQNGFIKIENFLPQAVFDQVLQEMRDQSFERFDMLQGSTVTRRAMIDDVDLKSKPGLNAAKNDPRMRDLIRYVASHSGEPLLTLQIVMALPSMLTTKDAVDPQVSIHSDTFQPTAKSWLFLQDVGEDDGPFSYVAGSHKMTPERYEWENNIAQNSQDLENKYSARGSLRANVSDLKSLGYEQPTKMTVMANTLIVADTHGFHARCGSPNQTTRIEIYGSLRRNPFLPFTGFHYGSLPHIKAASNRKVINAFEMMKKLKIRGNPWKSLGNGNVDEWPESLNKLRKNKI